MDEHQVKDYMITDLIVAAPQMEIRRAVHLLLKHGISGVPVIDDSGGLVGMLTERDCIEVALHASYHDEPGGTVQQYMSSPVTVVSPDTSLMDVAELLLTTPHRRFPVVDEGRLVGLISRCDVLRVLDKGVWFTPKN